MKNVNQLQVFQNNEFGQVRTLTIDNEPWFVADLNNIVELDERMCKHE